MLCVQIFKIRFNQHLLAFQCPTVHAAKCINICICIYMYMYVYIYIHIHMYMYTRVCVLRCFRCVRFFVTPCGALSVEFSRQES